MELLLELTVVALAVVVSGALGLLAWTLWDAAQHGVPRGRADVGRWRARLTDTEARLPDRASSIDAGLRRASAAIRRREGDR